MSRRSKGSHDAGHESSKDAKGRRLLVKMHEQGSRPTYSLAQANEAKNYKAAEIDGMLDLAVASKLRRDFVFALRPRDPFWLSMQ